MRLPALLLVATTRGLDAADSPKFGFVYAASSPSWDGYDKYDQLTLRRVRKTPFNSLFNENRTDHLARAVWSAARLGPSARVTIFCDDLVACRGEIAALASPRPRMACAALPEEHGGKGFRVAKIDAMLHSPYLQTVYIDSDTAPCVSAEAFSRVLVHKLNGADVLGRMIPAYEPALRVGALNGGVLALNTHKPAVRAFLRDWRERWLHHFRRDVPEGRKNATFGSKSQMALDQPGLQAALVAATSVRAWQLSRVWNMCNNRKAPGWSNFCCSGQAKSDCVIDHKCNGAMGQNVPEPRKALGRHPPGG